MSSEIQPAANPKWMPVLGWIISLLPGLAFLALGIIKLSNPEMMKPQQGAPDTGWRADAVFGLGILEVVGALLYLCPYTAILGAIILTGYLGGAIATHVRIGDWFLIPVAIGVLLWLGLVLRDSRLRAMLPFRSTSSDPAGPSGCMGAIGMILLTLLVLIGLLAAISIALPEDFRIARSQEIKAPPSKVFPHVVDFHKWKPWNPFSKPDPDIKITIEGEPGVGSVYKWSGNSKVGSGTMTITESVPNERIKIHLEFFEPFKDTGDAIFTFRDEKGNTLVTWAMEGKSDALEKVMRSINLMEFMIGPMFEQGLKDLQTTVESEK